ncbi:MAG: NUDIX hydrolase [Kineosporiaceae bacterium]
MGDGDGWVECSCGQRHWGRHGAVGLLLVWADGAQARVLVQHRAAWTHGGGLWGLPGGARDSHESLVQAALREAGEEAGPVCADAEVTATLEGTDHGDWRYDYVVARVPAPLAPVANDESEALTWVDLRDVPDLPLLPALAADWPRLREAALPAPTTADPNRP